MKDIDPTLGSVRNETSEIHADSTFCNLINRGGLSFPTQKLLHQVHRIYDLFCKYNPNFTIKSGPNCVGNFRKMLDVKMKNENIHPKILNFASKLFTHVRLNTINRQAKMKKTGALKNAQTLRGSKTTARLSQ